MNRYKFTLYVKVKDKDAALDEVASLIWERLLAAGYRRGGGDNIQLVMDRDEHRPTGNADDLETCSIIASGYEMNCPECGDFTEVGSSLKSIPDVVRCGVCGKWFKAETAEHCDG